MDRLAERYRDELKKLSGFFPSNKRLYAVGGCVRDALQGRRCYDVDLAGAATPADLTELLSASGFKVCPASPRLGTMIIKGEYAYEYTTFRTDSYPEGSGVHTPDRVVFTEDIEEDARRRDFKCNAVYYDIFDDRLCDPLGGVQDIENRILSTVVSPDTVLSQDGLRIMRLVRFVSTLGYSVEKETMQSAKKLAGGLRDISVERIRDELDKLLAGDNCYNALKLMKEIGALEIILPEVASNDNVAQKPEYHKYDVLEHCFKVAENCPTKIRLAGLLHDVGKGVCMRKDGNSYLHNTVGAEMTREIMTRLKYPVKMIDRTVRLVQEHMFDVNGNARECKYRRFIARNLDIIDDVIDLFKADCIGTGYDIKSRTAEKAERIYSRMLDEKVPMTLKQLNIDGNDLKSIGIDGRDIGTALNIIWNMALRNCVVNEKQALLKVARRLKNSLEKEKAKDNG